MELFGVKEALAERISGSIDAWIQNWPLCLSPLFYPVEKPVKSTKK
jgi:hypothetical protein